MEDMLFMYGLADGTIRKANCPYQESFWGCWKGTSLAFQRQWSICIEPNRSREAAVREDS
jgi:hypothetical protein